MPSFPGFSYFCLLINKAAQMIRASRVTQLAQCLGFDLANTLSGYVELFADFFEGVVGIHVDTETHAQYFRFSCCEAAKNTASDSVRLFLVASSRGRAIVVSSIRSPMLSIFVFTNGRLHGDWLFGDFETLRILSSGISMRSASSSGVGSRPIS